MPNSMDKFNFPTDVRYKMSGGKIVSVINLKMIEEKEAELKQLKAKYAYQENDKEVRNQERLFKAWNAHFKDMAVVIEYRDHEDGNKTHLMFAAQAEAVLKTDQYKLVDNGAWIRVEGVGYRIEDITDVFVLQHNWLPELE
jgi:predicted nucleic acid-binding protein